MGISDAREARRRAEIDKPKYATREPIAAIEKRVIDSPAYADLSPSAVAVLVLLARNLDKGRNGHTFITIADAVKHGISKSTLSDAFRCLQTHGFIYPTCAAGHGKCGRWALTWLPLTKDTSGLVLGNFQPFAWRDWQPQKKKGGLNFGPAVRNLAPAPPAGPEFSPRLGRNLAPLNVHTNSQLRVGAGAVDFDPTSNPAKPAVCPSNPAQPPRAAKKRVPATPGGALSHPAFTQHRSGCVTCQQANASKTGTLGILCAQGASLLQSASEPAAEPRAEHTRDLFAALDPKVAAPAETQQAGKKIAPQEKPREGYAQRKQRERDRLMSAKSYPTDCQFKGCEKKCVRQTWYCADHQPAQAARDTEH